MFKCFMLSVFFLLILSCSSDSLLPDQKLKRPYSADTSVFPGSNVALISAKSSVKTTSAGSVVTRQFLILVRNLAYAKKVSIHHSPSSGSWVDFPAKFKKQINQDWEIWESSVSYVSGTYSDRFAVRYEASGKIWWDNNNGSNYTLSDTCYGITGSSFPILSTESAYDQIQQSFNGAVILKNLAYQKSVHLIYTTDDWKTTKTAALVYCPSFPAVPGQDRGDQSPNSSGIEYWTWSVSGIPSGTKILYALSMNTAGKTFWDSNFGSNYEFTIDKFDDEDKTLKERVVYSTLDSEGDYELYLMDPDGTHPVQITRNQISDTHPVLSPDGSQIAFIQDYKPAVINTDGSSLKILNFAIHYTWSAGGYSSWSADGSQLLAEIRSYQHNSQYGTAHIIQINVADPAFSSYIVSASHYNDSLRNASYSPDGTRILYCLNNTIYIKKEGMDPVLITTGLAPSWNRQGNGFLYLTYDSSGYTKTIRSYDLIGEESSLIYEHNQSCDHPVYSHDGSLIYFRNSPQVYYSTDPLVSDLYVMGKDGSNPVKITGGIHSFNPGQALE